MDSHTRLRVFGRCERMGFLLQSDGSPLPLGLSATAQEWLSVHTPITGLYLTGQDVVSCGVMGAMIGGYLTAIAIKPQIAWNTLRILANL